MSSGTSRASPWLTRWRGRGGRRPPGPPPALGVETRVQRPHGVGGQEDSGRVHDVGLGLGLDVVLDVPQRRQHRVGRRRLVFVPVQSKAMEDDWNVIQIDAITWIATTDRSTGSGQRRRSTPATVSGRGWSRTRRPISVE